MPAPVFDFSMMVRVYYEDTDAGGVVYHSNYLNFMERCRCEWLHHLGFDVVKVEKEFGLIWVVREANTVFHQPARLFDELKVTCNVLQVGKVKLQLEQSVYNGEQLVCTAAIKLATLDSVSFKLTAMPTELTEILRKRPELN